MKKTNKYNVLVILSFLILLINQLQASTSRWVKPVATTAVVAGTTVLGAYGLQKNDQQPQEKMYRPVQTPGVQPSYSNFSYPSLYESAVKNVSTAVDKLDKFILDQLEDDGPIEGLSFSQLRSNRQRSRYLEQSFQYDQVSDDFNFPLIAHYTASYTNNEYNQFIAKVHEYASKDRSQPISMHDVDRAYTYVAMDLASRAMGRAKYPGIDEKVLDLHLRNNEKINEFMSPEKKLADIYHEAGHALMTILQAQDLIVTQLSVVPVGFSAGVLMHAFQIVPNETSLVRDLSRNHDRRLAQAKIRIKISLAGGIGHEILNGEKLSFNEFRNKYQAEMGSHVLVESDLYTVFRQLAYYLLYKNISFVSHFQEDLEPLVILNQEEASQLAQDLLEECYEEAYAILYNNKEILDKIVQGVLAENVMSGDKIYEIAGVERPKYDFEMSAADKIARIIIDWISWTHKRMAFYDRHHPTV